MTSDIIIVNMLFRCPTGTAEILSALTASFPLYIPNQNPDVIILSGTCLRLYSKKSARYSCFMISNKQI